MKFMSVGHWAGFPSELLALARSDNVDGDAVGIGKLKLTVLALGEELEPDLPFLLLTTVITQPDFYGARSDNREP